MSTETMQRVTRPWAELRKDAEWLAQEGCPYELALEHLGMTHEGLRSAYQRHHAAMPAEWKSTAGTSGRRWVDLHEDAEFMARTGCTFTRAAERLGISRDSLAAAYRRHNTPLPLAWRVEGR